MGQFPSKAESFMKTINLNTDNLGGLLHLYAIPPASFHRIRRDYVNDLNYLELVQRDDVIDIPIFANDTYIYTEEKSTGDVGDYWSITIEGVIPRLSQENQPVIEELERGLWYVVAQDSNGEIHFCGQEDALLLFTNSKTSGQSASSRNGTSFSFACIQDASSIFLTDFEENTL